MHDDRWGGWANATCPPRPTGTASGPLVRGPEQRPPAWSVTSRARHRAPGGITGTCSCATWSPVAPPTGHHGCVDVLNPPLWWSWLSWPTTLLTVAVGSFLYLHFASGDLDGRRRSGLVVATAVSAAAAAVPFLVGGSIICANGASLHANVWVLMASAGLWFIGLAVLGAFAGVTVPQVWVAPVLVLVAGVVGYIIESMVALHTISRYCDGVPGPLRLYTALSIGVPVVVVAAGGGAAWIAQRGSVAT
jgi:hypothetical protein